MTAEDVIRTLGLAPHPEGGYFAEIHRSPLTIESAVHNGPRRAATAIYFLLRTGEFSAIHRVRSDEAWHHYAGDSLDLYEIEPDAHQVHRLGPHLDRGERPLVVMPALTWQAARPVPGAHGYVLCGCTVAPGFEFADFEMPSRAELLQLMPKQGVLVEALTR